MIEFDEARYAALKAFMDELETRNFLRGALSNIKLLHSKYGEEYVQVADDILTVVKKLDVNPVDVFEEYLYEYVRDLARFQKTGTYDNGSFEEIRERIYDNAELMSETYLPGLFLAYGFTSLLHEKYKFFEKKFLPRLDAAMKGVEVGFGDGFYLWIALKTIAGSSVDGYDISQHAVDFSNRLMSASQIDPARCNLQLGDLCGKLPVEPASYDWCVLTEVIEHVADPIFSIQEIGRIVRPGGLLFIATVIDSNHMDHITNFENPEELVTLLKTGGFEVEDTLKYTVADEVENCRDDAVGLAHICRKA